MFYCSLRPDVGSEVLLTLLCTILVPAMRLEVNTLAQQLCKKSAFEEIHIQDDSWVTLVLKTRFQMSYLPHNPYFSALDERFRLV